MFPKRDLACGRGVSRRFAADVTKALLDSSYGHRSAKSVIGRWLSEFVLWVQLLSLSVGQGRIE
jgi:hypothetical protein